MKDTLLFNKHAELVNLIGAQVTNKKLHSFYDRALKAAKKPAEPQDLLSLNGKIKAIIDDLNKRTGKQFSARCEPTHQAITARLAEGFTADDFILVHTAKCTSWLGTKFDDNLCPGTLYRKRNFHRYVDAIKASKVGPAPKKRKW